MKDINISVDTLTHSVSLPDTFLGIGNENLQGNLIFQFNNAFPIDPARLEVAIDGVSGMIPNLETIGNGYVVPIRQSLLTGQTVTMQLVVDQTSLATYELTTDTTINPNKTYYTKVGDAYIIVSDPVQEDIGTYYEANVPIFKTNIFTLQVKQSINAVAEMPSDYPGWIETFSLLEAELNEAIYRANNLDIEVSDKIDGVVTITFTNKSDRIKVVTIEDGSDYVLTSEDEQAIADIVYSHLINADEVEY